MRVPDLWVHQANPCLGAGGGLKSPSGNVSLSLCRSSSRHLPDLPTPPWTCRPRGSCCPLLPSVSSHPRSRLLTPHLPVGARGMSRCLNPPLRGPARDPSCLLPCPSMWGASLCFKDICPQAHTRLLRLRTQAGTTSHIMDLGKPPAIFPVS